MNATTNLLRKLWNVSPPLMVSAAAHLAALAAFVVLAFVDQRVVNGQLAWIKPAKFAISGAIYTVTLAWVMTHIEGRRRALGVVSWIVGAGLAFEVVLIALQAGRGTISHFNVATPFDMAVFTAMGMTIFAVWISGWTVPVLLLRQRFVDPALASALRIGTVVAMLGAATGGLMTAPSAPQRQAMQRGEQPQRTGSHAVGVPDGGEGLPVVGWTTKGGDLRVGHFLGLHAFQAIPLAGLLIRRRGAKRGLDGRTQRRQVLVVAGGYLGLISVLVVQALRAEPLIAPSGFTVAMLGAVAAATGIAWAVASRRESKPAQAVSVSGSVASAA